MQLLFGHESAPIEGEAFDDEQQNPSITVSMAERLARQQSALKAWLQAKAESRVERAHTRCSTLALWNSCLPLESRRSEYGLFAHDSAGIYRNLKQTQKVHGWVLRQFWLRKWVGVRSNTEKLMTQSGSWYKVDFCDVHPNTYDISANVKACQSTERKETRRELERSLTLFRISVFRKAHTLIFEVSRILLMGPSHDTSVERQL